VLAPATITPSSSARIGSGTSLAEAVRDINDGAEILADVRRNGTSGAKRGRQATR